MTVELVQGTNEWKMARCGSLGASRIADAVARTKSGWGASRANLMAELIAERLTGVPTDGFVNAAMVWGTEKEPEARIAYEFMKNSEVVEVGLIKHPSIIGTHASPDGLIGIDGLIEIKCPSTNVHLDTLLGQSIQGKYFTQIQWQLACCDRQWCDFVSYDPRLPPAMQLFVKRVPRDAAVIAELEAAVRDFIAELEAKLAALTKIYGVAA